MKKKGQIFLIASLIIIGIILTLGSIYVSTKTSPRASTQVLDLSKEIDFESNKVIDYGVYSGVSVESNLSELILTYSAQNPGTDLIFIYSDEQGNIKETKYIAEVSTGSVAASSASIPIIEYKDLHLDIRRDAGKIIVPVPIKDLTETANYTFDLKEGENFFIVLRKKTGEEQIVVKQG
ncbi:MAG: hypothetical protein QXD13_01260 [Candidatus Pacearchaeota archaeon]